MKQILFLIIIVSNIAYAENDYSECQKILNNISTKIDIDLAKIDFEKSRKDSISIGKNDLLSMGSLKLHESYKNHETAFRWYRSPSSKKNETEFYYSARFLKEKNTNEKSITAYVSKSTGVGLQDYLEYNIFNYIMKNVDGVKTCVPTKFTVYGEKVHPETCYELHQVYTAKNSNTRIMLAGFPTRSDISSEVKAFISSDLATNIRPNASKLSNEKEQKIKTYYNSVCLNESYNLAAYFDDKFWSSSNYEAQSKKLSPSN